MLTKNILATHIKVGVVKESHLLLVNTKPKCEIWVQANAALSAMDAFFSPIDFSKLERRIPLKNNSSPIRLKVIPVNVIIINKIVLSPGFISFGIS